MFSGGREGAEEEVVGEKGRDKGGREDTGKCVGKEKMRVRVWSTGRGEGKRIGEIKYGAREKKRETEGGGEGEREIENKGD